MIQEISGKDLVDWYPDNVAMKFSEYDLIFGKIGWSVNLRIPKHC